MSDPMTEPSKPSLWRVVRDQRKIELVGLGLVVASFWIVGQLGEWTLAGCIAGGVLLGLANHLATEYWLLKTISSGEQPTRNQMIASTIVRLTVLTVVAVGLKIISMSYSFSICARVATVRSLIDKTIVLSALTCQ